MAEKEGSRKEKKKKSKSKHCDIDEDFVDMEVSKAMRQVEKAMGQVKLAEKQAKQAKKQGKQMAGNPTGMHIHTHLPSGAGIHTGEGGTVFHNNVTTHHGTYINIQNAQNVQVGNNNTMVIKGSSKKKKSKKKCESDDDDDDDDDDNLTTQRDELMEFEKLPILSSKRLVNAEDIGIICTKVSNWRRFLRFLNLEESEIERVYEENFHLGGVKEILLMGVTVWQRKAARDSTVDIVAKALLKIECFDAVRELQP